MIKKPEFANADPTPGAAPENQTIPSKIAPLCTSLHQIALISKQRDTHVPLNLDSK
jgi:hypothetical protein